jgi:TPR repeat protein
MLGLIARADGFEQGMDLLKSGNAAGAAKVLQDAEKQGDARAQYFLGLLYFHGKGVQKDIYKAEQLWKKSG